MKVMLASEAAHMEAILAYRRALRAGDLVAAERWLRCAERLYRLKEHARRDARQWKDERRAQADARAKEMNRVSEARAWARLLRATEHQRRLAALEAGDVDANGSHTAGRGTEPFPHDKEG